MRGMVCLAVAGVWALAGCSSNSDPYESTNRSFYDSHQKLYKNVIKPVAVFYNNTAPEPARDGVPSGSGC